MNWIYLSPHFDDAAFSCGGLIWEHVQKGDQVSIFTVCAGEPPAGSISDYAQGLHARWETGLEAVALRREENRRSCQVLGAEAVNFTIPDVIYRRSTSDGSPICESDADLTAALRPEESYLIAMLKKKLDMSIPPDCEIVSPLAIGGHIDHKLTRAAVELLGRPARYYADFPYLLDLGDPQVNPEQRQMCQELHPISERGLDAWQASIAAHSSQISTFWRDAKQMREAVQAYWEPTKGLKIWHFG